MLGGRSIKLARIFGIRIGVDPSWFFILFLIIWGLSESYTDVFPGEGGKAFAVATASALLFFASVVLHELGHALVAVRNGIGIAGIDLWLLGGVAKMRRETQSAGVDFKVAVAGPLVTLAIVALCVAIGTVLTGNAGEFITGTIEEDESGIGAAEAILGYLAFINGVLLLFNLLPGLPLDGGRIVRAVAWARTGDRARATRIAAAAGRGVAYLLAGFGLFLLLNGVVLGAVWLFLVAFFMTQAARTVVAQTAVTSRIEGLCVADVMDADPVSLPSQTRLDRALEEFFLRYRWPWFPVTDHSGRYLGYVSREKVEEVPEQLRPTWTIDEVMQADTKKTMRVGLDEPLEALLGYEALRRLGAVMAVDDDEVLRGVVTIDQVRRALRPPAPVL